MDSSTPLWTEKTGRSGGRDHLGLQSVGQSMLEELSSGISNITKRIRYYSFFCWVIDSFFSSGYEKTRENYKKYLNDMCLLYTLSSSSVHLDDSLTGIDGIEFARNWLQKIISGEKVIDEKTYQSREYLNNNWIYKAKLNDLLLTSEDVDESGIPSLIDPWGKELARAFGETVKDIPFSEFSFSKLKPDFIEKLEKLWCFHRVKENIRERQLLEDILFARHAENRKKQTNRRYSLLLMLVYIDRFHKFNKSGFEQWIYDDSIELPDKLTRIKRLWKVLLARNYLTFAFESLFLYFLTTIKDKSLTFEDFAKQINLSSAQEKDALITKYSSLLDFGLNDVLSQIYDNKIPAEHSNFYEPTIILNLDTRKRHVQADNLPKFLVYPLFCLMSLHVRFKAWSSTPDEALFLSLGNSYRVSLDTLFYHIDLATEHGVTFREFILSLYNTNILSRHMTFAHDKYWSRGLDTYHFQLEDNRYVSTHREDEFEPMFNFMKFDEILNYFVDLDIIKRSDQETITITDNGRRIITEFYG